jgi:sugar phosphate permease
MSKVVTEHAGAIGAPSRKRWAVVLVLAGLVVTGFFDRISIAVLFTHADFYNSMGIGFNPAKLGLLMTAFLLAYGVSAVCLSILGDLFRPARALGFAAGVWGIVMMCMGATSSYGVMILLRVALGIAEGPQFPLLSKVVYRWFPPGERARANSLWMSGSPIGSAIGFPLSIWLVAAYGWRASFYILGLLSLLIMMPLVLSVVAKEPADANLVHAVAAAPRERPQLRLFLRNYRFWLLTVYGCGLLTYLWGLNGWLPTYLERARHFDLHEMGVFSALPFIMMFLGVIAGGIISDRTGRNALVCFLGLLGAGLLMYAGTHAADARVAATVIALSAGCWGMCQPTQYALAMKLLPGSTLAAGLGAMNGISNLVGALAPALIGWVVARTGDFNIGLLVIVIASVGGSCLVLPLLRRA